MANTPPPILLALIPSEVVHKEAYFGRYSALNFLGAMRFADFPTPVVKVGIFLAVTAVRGRTLLEVELVNPDGTAQTIFDWDLDPTLPVNPLEVYQQGANIGVSFAVPGEFRFRALADRAMMGEWTIHVVR